MLVSVAMFEERQRLFVEMLPLEDVGSNDLELAGRSASPLERWQRQRARSPSQLASARTLTRQRSAGIAAVATAT